MLTINIRCKGSIYLGLDEIYILQDVENSFILKELSEENFEKLKENIIRDGFWFPFFVWHCKEENRWYYLDGTQRDKVLRWMRSQPNIFKLPDKFPCAEIEADSKQEAARAILEQSSAYGQFTDDGLYGFINYYNLQDEITDLVKRIEIPGYDMDKFINGYIIDNDKYPGDDNDFDVERELEKIKEPKTKLGDLYLLGNHRLLCGDATKMEDVERLMVGQKADMVFTDPPYDIEFDEFKKCIDILNEVAINNIIITATDSLCVKTIKYCDWKFRCFHFCYIPFALPTYDYFYRQHIPLIHFYRDKIDFINTHNGFTSVFKLYEYKGNNLEFDVNKQAKPVELPERYIKSFKCKNVLDLFGGSGSTLIACEKVGRNCFMMEIDPVNCDVIIQRWEQFTGLKAVKSD